MTYIVFARKWRPKNFDEVIGQPHVTTTLKNAITSGRVAHAYLFSGPRGIGKTTTARILAKALNCIKGPTVGPCEECDSCREITSSTSLDVLEIDGASNRGIDEIRDLRENVKFAPARGKFKVYIIDEVHMLTDPAFNALLKTLEEPPAHVKFIFATTQPHKVPQTILSRCQRFDFKRIPTKDILSKLKQISEAENLKVKDEALFYIARFSGGSMRDAESVLDQLINFCEEEIRLEEVISLLGMVREEIFFDLTQALIDKDANKGLEIIDGLMNEGKDGLQFLNNWIEHFRNLMIAKVQTHPSGLIDLPREAIGRLTKQGEAFSMEELIYVINFLGNIQVAIKRAMPARMGLEVAVVKLARREEISSLDEILEKVKDLEQRVGEGGGEGPPEEEEKPTPAEVPQITLDRVKEVWPDVLKKVKVEKISAASFLVEGAPVEVKGSRVILGFSPQFSFHREALEEKVNKSLIEKALSEKLGCGVKVAFAKVEKLEKVSGPPGAKPKATPIVQSAIEIFGGKIVKEE